MKSRLLGGFTPKQFLARHWQKKPLLIRAAMPGFTGVIHKQELFALAGREDVESRLVRHTGRNWLLRHGPFRRAELSALPRRDWTLLVQGLNHSLPAADALLRRFAFMPYARLDDVMVSYAAPGGGVGPHLDSYDVFLLQGEGRRLWRISRQADAALDKRAPLKILGNFRSEAEWILEPGDMLYLPPDVAHEGVALDSCTTYSIGFRAPAAQELAEGFLDFLQERLALTGRYADPDLAPTRHPAALGTRMVEDAVRRLAGIRWSRRDVEHFLGEYLSEPKPGVRFEPPSRPLAAAAFAARCLRMGLRLDARTLLLYRGRHLYLNGETLEVTAAIRPILVRLADARALPPGIAVDGKLRELFYTWYRQGYLAAGAGDE